MSSTSTTEAARPREGTLYQWALALPGTAVILATAAILGGVFGGVDPLWYVEPLTLPEAAGLRDNGEVARLIAGGGNPDAAGPVRPGFVHNDEKILTPLEAAVGDRRADMVRLLLDNGATMEEATWNRLVCFADVVKAGDVRELLEERRPAGAAAASCEAVKTPW